MPEYGVTPVGFRSRSLTEIDDYLRVSATGSFRRLLGESNQWDLSWDDLSPACVFYRVIEPEIYRLWQGMESVYYASSPLTAVGDGLDLLVAEHGLIRRPASKATGIVSLRGDPGTVVRAGTVLSTASGTQFVTKTDVVIGAQGRVDVWIESVQPGTVGNVLAGAITVVESAEASSCSVASTYEETNLGVDVTPNVQWSIPANGSEAYWQVVRGQDIAHPHRVTEIRFRVRNGTAQNDPIKYRLRCGVTDHRTGRVIGLSAEQEITLARGEDGVIVFGGLELDVGYGVDEVRLVLVNLPDSAYPIEVLGNTTNPYPGGYWWQNGVVQTGHAALFRIISVRPGYTWGGADAESDPELRARYFESKAMGGASHLAAIQSRLWGVRGVRALRVRHNREDIPVGGLPPHSVHVIVQGGESRAIAARLFESVPVGIKLIGEVVVDVEDRYKERHPIRFSRPTVREIYAAVTVRRGPGFTLATLNAVKDAVIRVVGGFTADGQYHTSGIGQAISYAKVIESVLQVPGVADLLALKLDTKTPPENQGNVEVGETEIAEGSLNRIEVTWV